MHHNQIFVLEYANQILEAQKDADSWYALFESALVNWQLSLATRLIAEAKQANISLPQKTKIFMADGRLAMQIGEWQRAERSFSQALLNSQEGNEQSNILAELGMLFRLQGKYGEALQQHKKMYTLGKQMKNNFIIAESLHHLGLDEYERGNFPQAESFLTQAAEMSRNMDDVQSLARTLNALGLVFWRLDNLAIAQDNFSQALDIFRASRDVYSAGQSLANLGNIAWATGNFSDAQNYYLQALEIFQQFKAVFDIVGVLNNLGGVSISLENYGQAEKFYQESLLLASNLGDLKGQRDALLNLAKVSNMQNRWDSAEKFHYRAWALTKKINDRGALWDLWKRKMRSRLLYWIDLFSKFFRRNR